MRWEKLALIYLRAISRGSENCTLCFNTFCLLAFQAKLPRGIKNIQPHLENVDNVPLLVSLFTDCTPDVTEEMLKIMQSFGEIVVCVGSSANTSNSSIFLQADCSIAVEPLFPLVSFIMLIFNVFNALSKNKSFEYFIFGNLVSVNIELLFASN